MKREIKSFCEYMTSFHLSSFKLTPCFALARRSCPVLFVVVGVVVNATNSAAGAFSGSLSSYPTYVSSNEKHDRIYVESTLRTRYFSAVGDLATVEMAYELSPILWLSPRASSLAGAETRYRTSDPQRVIYPRYDDDDNKRMALYQNLDRLNINYRFALFDLSIGRQAIAFGVARGVSPNDVVLPFSPVAIDKGDRSGVDAIRAKAPLSSLSEVDFGAIFGRDAAREHSAYFIRPRFNLMKTDITLSALSFLKNQSWGLELQTLIGNASGWLDGAVTRPSQGNDVTRVSIGIDYSFTVDIYTALEYHYNGAGSDKMNEYQINALQGQPYRDEYVYLLGKNYLIPILGYFLTPLISTSGSLFINLDDHSLLATLRVEYNVLENAYLAAGGFLGASSGRSGNEFGRYPKTTYGALRLYF